MTYHGRVCDGVITLDAADSLPEGSRVEVRLIDSPTIKGDAQNQLLLRHAGTIADLLADAAEQLDHYLYGAPRR